MKNPDVFQRMKDCNTCGQPDCKLGYPTPIGYRFFCSNICANVYLGYPLDFEIELDDEKHYFFESESIEEGDILPIGTKVRSYDFVIGDKILDDSTYMEGYIMRFSPVPNCSPDCNHYHILTTRIMRKGEEIPVDDETWTSTFTTHWDNSGVIPLPDNPYDITTVKDAESFSAETAEGNQVFNSCWKCGAGQHLWEIARFPATGRQISGVGGNPEEQINLDEVLEKDREVMKIMSAESDEKFYMVHRHDANRAGLHFDLRLEDDGSLKSWAIPKGMPTSGRHLAIQTPDHSMDYGKWEGTIKSGYGAGDVKIDTSGTYETIDKSSNNWKFKILTGKYQGVWRLTHWKEDKWLISKSRGEN